MLRRLVEHWRVYLHRPDHPDQWYVFNGRGTLGPLAAIEVGRLAGEGEISPNDTVWSPDLGEWRQACAVPGLLDDAKSDEAAHLEETVPAANGGTNAKTSEAAPNRVKRSWLAGSYVGRHWQGELSLPVSYFINGFLATLVAGTTMFAISATLAVGYAPLSGLVAVVGIWSILLIISLWQFVGIWRSANNHPKRGGRVFWAGLAKFMVIVGVLQTAAVFSQNGWPQIKESFWIVGGDPSVGTFELRLINGGTEIEFAGGMPFGATDEVAKLLDAAPDVHLVHLNSHGGRIAEAKKLRDLIRERKLSTYTSSECLSACTVAYLGGHERFLHRNGRLGFHAGSFPGVSEADMSSENRRIADEAVLYGVERKFAEKAYLSPSDDMWFPKTEKLLQAGFVTRMARGEFGVSGFGPRPSRDAIASELVRAPLFAAISKREPPIFSQMVEIFLEGVASGRPEGEVLASMRAIMSNLLTKYLHLSSDEALFMFAAVMIEELEAIGMKDRLACYKFLFPQSGQSIDVRDYLGPDLLTKDVEMAEMVITTGMAGSSVTNKDARLQELYDKVGIKIAEKYDETTVQELLLMGSDASAVPRENICGLTEIFYREIMGLPRDEALQVLRNLMTP